ncbi:hypothetical protein BJX99DRAFT_245966 [Aspergillus californicus]
MTFCCRPSQNCLRCRQRRIKCDRVRPECSQCKRAGKECAGYREETSMLFRDENERTIRRAIAAKERSLAKQQAIVRRPQTAGVLSDAGTTSEVTISKFNTVLVLNRPMPITPGNIDSQGLQFFIHHFSTVPWFDGSFLQAQNFAVVQDLDADPSFRGSVVSIGLAAMSNVRRDNSLLDLARQRHGVTLREVRKAIARPSSSNVGNILRLILMLAIFEMVDAKPEAKSPWTIHITGVAALLKQFPFPRGREFNTQAELWFYFAVIVNYLQVGGPFPAELNNWSALRLSSSTGETWPAFELVDILIKFVRFCADSPRRQAKGVENILREVLNLDLELQDWMNRLPAQWSFVVKETTDMPGTFYGIYHVYQNVWASRVLNQYHLSRLLVNEVILAYISKLEEPLQWNEQAQRSLRVVTQMATDICVGIATQGLFSDSDSLPIRSQPRPLMKGIFMRIYPLRVAASATGVPEYLRNWAVERLQNIGDRMGIRQALKAIPRIQLHVATNEMGLALG